MHQMNEKNLNVNKSPVLGIFRSLHCYDFTILFSRSRLCGGWNVKLAFLLHSRLWKRGIKRERQMNAKGVKDLA